MKDTILNINEYLYKHKILKIFVWVSFISLFFQIINGLWSQISMFLFNGRVIFPNIVFKFTFLTGLFISFLIQRKILTRSLLKLWILFVGYLFFHFFYLLFYLGYDWKMVLFGYNSYYFWLITLIFTPSLSGIISEKTIIRVFAILSIPIIILGLAQHFTNSSILPIKSSDGYFEALSYNFYGNVRAFSFFTSGLEMAFWNSFLAIFFIIYYLKKRQLIYLFLFLFSCYIVYITYTRSGYLILLFSLVSLVIDKYVKVISLKKLPILYFILSIFLLFSLYFYGKSKVNPIILEQYKNSQVNSVYLIKNKVSKKVLSGDYNVYSANQTDLKFFKSQGNNVPVNASDSFFMRIINWKMFLSILKEDKLYFLFGSGIYQNKYFNDISNFAIDNMYFATLIHIGFIGLIVFLYFIIRIYFFLLSFYKYSLINYAIIVVFTTFFLSGFFNEVFIIYSPFLQIFMLSYKINTDKEYTI